MKTTLLLLAAFLAAPALRAQTTPPIPASGTELLQRMHDRYQGKWFRDLTFVQATTVTRPDGSTNRSTWYESMLSPDRLRIDFGDPALGNGALYTADSTYRLQAGKVTRAVAQGNPFIPFVAAIYAQPLDSTVADLAAWHFDLSKVRADSWEGHPVFVAGAATPDDSTSPQFWVDADRLILLRMIVPLGSSPTSPPLDVHMENYVPLGGSWLATTVVMSSGGAVRQTEEYSDYKIDQQLPAQLFDPSAWSAAAHWAHPKP